MPSGASGYIPLILSPVGISPYSQRGSIIQSYAPLVQSAQIFETVNGLSLDFSNPKLRKWSTTIQCTDQRAPPLFGLFPGNQLTIYCIEPWNYKVGTPGAAHLRPYRTDYTPWDEVTPDGTFHYYFPILDCVIESFNPSGSKWQAEVSWSMTARERIIPTGPFP